MNGNELVSIDKIDIVSFFTKDDDMDKILKRIREASCRDLIQNCDTAANRKAIGSMAYKVAQSKIMLEKAGKELVKDLLSDIKVTTNKINASRQHAWDYLEALKDEIRLPLTNWEIAEKEREEKERLDAELAEVWDAAHAEHELFLRQEAIEKKEAEFARIEAEKKAVELQKEHDERIKQEAFEQAKKQAEIEETKRRNLEVEERRNLIIQAEKEKAEKEKQFNIEKEKALADLKAKIENEEKEKNDLLEKEKALAEKKASNIAHQKKINNIVLEGLTAEGITEDQGKKIIAAIVKNKIKHLVINY